jgi:hypothetical protein
MIDTGANFVDDILICVALVIFMASKTNEDCFLCYSKVKNIKYSIF